MTHYALSTFLFAATAMVVLAQGPLADRRIPFNEIPYMVDTTDGPRGIQTGYNRCNATTEGQTSRCQTAFINSIDDFCLWGPPDPNSTIGDTEGEAVAWCTRPGRGTRLIPAGTLQGVQFMRTPAYIQVVGFINQTMINIAAGDTGGELDPHGADQRGNPLGGLLYSNGYPSNGGNNNTFQQVIEWHNFVGSDFFCFKACDPAGADDARYCEHIYDRIGCAYNAPNAAQTGQFVSCQGENQDFPGVYVSNGATMTYTQPPESLGPITTIPYTARIPASSNCVTYQSAQLYTALPGSTSSSSSTAAPTGSSTSRPAGSGSSSSRSGTGAAASSTGNSAASFGVRGGIESGAVAGAMTGAIGVLFAVVFLA